MSFILRDFVLILLLLCCKVLTVRIDSIKEISVDSTSITIQWLPVSSQANDLADWKGFKIKYRLDNDENSPANIVTVNNISETRYRLDKLQPNTAYRIQISAFKNDGDSEEGPSSNPFTAKTTETVPGVPQDIKITKITRTSFDVEWKPPKRSEDYGIIRGYQINYFKVNSQINDDLLIQQQKDAVKSVKVKARESLKSTIKDLEPGATYKLQIFAFNSKGDGTRSPQFLVTTLDDLPGKPENLRAQIYNDELHIQWMKPKNSVNQIDGYRLFFNTESFDLDANQDEFILKRPKWDYNQQYDIRIAAKSSKNNSVYGEEAVHHIKTQESSKKLSLIVDKRTSTSAQLKWQEIKFDGANEQQVTSYKLEYYLKDDQLNDESKKIVDLEGQTEYLLANLQPNSVYIVQLNAYPSSTDTTQTEETIIYFQTLNSDIQAPKNLKIDRLNLESIYLKWEQPDLAANEHIKSYKVYISEFNNEVVDNMISTLNWIPIDVNDWKSTELTIKYLELNKNYAFKVVAVDDKDREGAESNVVFLYRTTDDQQKSDNNNPNKQQQQQLQSYQVNPDLGQPRDIQAVEISSTQIRFAWLPPINTQLQYETLKKLSYRITYIDRPKTYRDSDNQIKTYTSSNQVNVLVDARDDLTMRITWLVAGLNADTEYDFNISTVLDQNKQGPPVQRTIKTKRDKPAYVERSIIKEIYEDNTVLVQFGNASEKNGPISKYWHVIVPQREFYKYEDSYEHNLNELLRISLNATNDEYLEDYAFITAEFDLNPPNFLLGTNSLYGRFVNRALRRGVDYKLITIAFTDMGNNAGQNRLGLDKVLASHSRGGVNSKLDDVNINNMYTFSQFSDVFNTISIESAARKKPTDYHNYLWILGAAIALVFVLIMIIVVIAVRTKKKNGHTILNNKKSSLHHQIKFSDEEEEDQLDNKATLIPHTQTNTTTSNASSTLGNGVYGTSSNANGGYINNAPSVSPPITTTLGRHSHQTNTLNSTTMGLLTTVQHNTPQHTTECLYTSIDAAQRQHLLNNYSTATSQQTVQKTLYTSYDPHTGTLNTTTSTHTTPQYDPLSDLKRLHQPHSNHHHHQHTPQHQQQVQQLQPQPQPPIMFEDLSGFIELLKQNQNEKFQMEYESIEPNQQFTWDMSTKEYNRHKNRYANVIAYDHSRVVLQPLFDPQTHTQILGSDYINANYIDGYNGKPAAYVATQGPLPTTYGDFWRMIWETNSSIIVMMTKLEERNRLKCDQYWPSKGAEVYGNVMQVTLVDVTELATYTVRTFILARLGSNEQKREIKHFQFTAWPDNGVPEHSTSFLMFLRRVNMTAVQQQQQQQQFMGPITVHCSAGVGRTGCFIVIDIMMERVMYEKTVDIYGCVTQLRAQRNYMVQTEDQYQFCYDATLEIIQSGQTEINARNLYQHLEALLQQVDDNSPLTEMELEYKRLVNIKAPQTKFQSANMACNKFKNRLVNILPYEATRVCLSMQQNPTTGQLIEGSDYVNANFIDGYKYRKAYIATQAPLQETVDDFWRMLWETNSTIIVMLTKLREMGREKCAQYWPSECSIRYQNFVIDPIAEYNMSQYILREFKITDARDGQSRTIRQFQYCDWPEQGVPKSGESIIELIGQVHKTKEQFGQVGPITVHCSAGVGRTGVFITLSCVLERMRYEGMIDVFNTVKMLRTQRPAMVQTEDQYQFCYRAALEYLGSFDNYES